MTADRKRHRAPLVAVAALALIVSGLAVPIVAGLRGAHSGLRTNTVRAAARDSFLITEPLTLSTSPRIVLEKGLVSIAPDQASEAHTGEAQFALLKGGGANLILDDAVIRFSRGPALVNTAHGIDARLDAEQIGPILLALAQLNFNRLSINGATISLTAPDGSEEKLASLSADVSLPRKAKVLATGTLRLQDADHPFTLSVGLPQGKHDALLPVRGTLRGPFIEATFDGRFTPGERSQLTASAADLKISNVPEIARWLAADWPAGGFLQKFKAKGLLTWSGDTISFEDARFMLDDNAATGGLSMTLGEARPALEGTLAFDNLNLRPYMAEPKSGADTSFAIAAAWLPLADLTNQTSPSLIRGLDADLRVSAASVTVASGTLGRCAATLSTKNGKLFADLAEVELEQGGTGDAQLSVDMTGDDPRYNVRAHFDDFDMARVSSAHLGSSVLEGTGTLSVDLSAKGSTEGALVSSLSGMVEIDMPQGGKIAADLDSLLTATPTDAAAWTAARSGTTSLDMLNARFLAAQGAFTAETLRASIGDRTILGTGTIDLARQTADLSVTIAGVLARAGAYGESVPSPGFRVEGPWSALRVVAVSSGAAPDDTSAQTTDHTQSPIDANVLSSGSPSESLMFSK